MKKTIAIAAVLLIALFVFTLIPQQVFAAPEGMVVVYASVPEDWENPCLWAWDDAGNGVFSAWPGGEAEADPNNAGWYYCYLPNWANNIIINANEGTVQTDALQTEGKNVWVTVKTPEEADISFEALTTGEAPEYVEKIAVFARVPANWDAPCLWAWLDPAGTNAFAAWPGGAMRLTGDWYTVKAPSWINSVIINGNEGSDQTADYKDLEQGKDIWIVVADDHTAEIYYENPDLIVPDITVHAYVPADWENPCLWAWSHPDGTNAFASWPGEPFSLNGDWYEISLPGWVNSFIVNANGGAIQTGDMKELEIGRDLWIVVTDSDIYEYDYSEIAIPAAPDTPDPSPVAPQSPSPPPEPSAPPAEPSQPEPDGGNNTLLIVLGISGALIIIAVIVIVVVKKKK